MPLPAKRWLSVCAIAILLIIVLFNVANWNPTSIRPSIPYSGLSDTNALPGEHPEKLNEEGFNWKKVPQRYPITTVKALPTGRPVKIPQIQHNFKGSEDSESKKVREERLQAVKTAFSHAWQGYKEKAWRKDEVTPISGGFRDSFGGWAATLVDSLDTLWIMDFRDDFDKAVNEIDKIDFSKSSEEHINIFETTIRYLGGFLSAYDLSSAPVLLRKAIELGDMLYVAFDTPNRMPITRWNWKEYDSRS